MTIKESARAWVNSIVWNHVAKNIKQCKSPRYYVGEKSVNQLGGTIYLSDNEGTVVDANEEFTLIKTDRTDFLVVLNSLLSKPVEIGEKVATKFYQLRRFDGTLADGSQDPSVDGFTRFTLTGTESMFPVKWTDRHLGVNNRFANTYTEIQNPYLRDLIVQMEKLPVNGGLRNVVNVLIDANPTNLRFNDPVEERSMEDRPSIMVHVNTGKFVGDVAVIYNRVPDTYTVKLTPGNGAAELEVEDINFDQLGKTLIDGIDDGTWKLAKITTIKAAPKKRAPKAAVSI